MRISDWSSDVCSSDLALDGGREDGLLRGRAPWLALAQRRAGAERKHEKNRGRGARDAHRQRLRRWRDAGNSNRWIVVLSGPHAPIPRKTHPRHESATRDRKSDVEGKSVSVRVDIGVRRFSKKK